MDDHDGGDDVSRSEPDGDRLLEDLVAPATVARCRARLRRWVTGHLGTARNRRLLCLSGGSLHCPFDQHDELERLRIDAARGPLLR